MALYYDEILAGNCLGQINIMPPPSSNNAMLKEKTQTFTIPDELGFSIEELFYMARQFLKEKQSNNEIQLKYGDNIRLVALSKQVKMGKWEASYTQDVGFLDVVGNDRKQAWMALGDMTKEQAMEEYIKLLLDRYAMFRTYIESQQLENEENDRLRQDDETRRTLEQQAERVRQYELEQFSRLEKQQKKREDFQRKQIQEVLNQQTYSQFKAYAEQQYRDNREAQEELIRQLQEQHFQQYMQQVYQQQLLDQQQLRTKVNMEQQPTENVISSIVQPPTMLANIVPPPSVNIVPPLPGTFIVPPTTLNIAQSPAPTNVITASSPTNVAASPISANMALATHAIPSPLTNIPLQSFPPMPLLGPAPMQLPPLVHPPPPIPLFQSTIDNNNAIVQEIKLGPMAPIQTQFDTLSLNTPLELIHSTLSHPSIGHDLAPQQFSAAQINNELGTTQELVDGNSMVSPMIDGNTVINPNGELSLVPDEGKRETPNIVPANMWTRKDVKEFKDQIRAEKDGVIKVGSGETVTVRVPTHEDGQCIFWEFATDYYDLGFGLYFEWSKAQSNTVTVHVSDSSDEEENEEGAEKKDIEKGSGSTNKPPKPPQDEIVPIYRRDSHEEVYAGSHPYPGHGVYLLKFDNSYSLWRSKTLYYRVYYSK